MKFETEIQEKTFEAIKNSKLKDGELIFEGMFRPFGYHKKVPSFMVEFNNGKQKMYCIDSAGYDVYIPMQ